MKSQDKIIEIMNKARSYETDRDKTLPFTFKECERAVTIALQSEKEKIIEEIKRISKELISETPNDNDCCRWSIKGFKERVLKSIGDEEWELLFLETIPSSFY